MSTIKTFVLQEIIDQLVNDDKSLVPSLMKLLYFAQLIKNQELIEYASKELNGYKGERNEIPTYRRTPGTVIATLQAGWNTHQKTIPMSIINEPLKSLVQYVYIFEGIRSIEIAVADIQKDGSGRGIVKPIPMELLYLIQPGAAKLFKSDISIGVVEAKVTANENVLFQIIDAVRSKLLALVMEIGEKFGFDIEIESFKKDAKNNQIINNYMNTNITNTGDGNIVNTGADSTITATISITQGDFDSLRKQLSEVGIEERDVEELKIIVESETPDFKNKTLGPKASNWVGKVFAKVLGGATKLATTAAGHLLADWIWHFYGV